jgi:hypothetical protein
MNSAPGGPRKYRINQDRSQYSSGMGETHDGADRDPISEFLASPARQYDEDVEPADSGEDDYVAGSVHASVMRRLYHFMFEKNPSSYSSISPRRADGSRTKIFFFNGSGRGR